MLVRTRHTNNTNANKRDCSCCEKPRCQVCKVIVESNLFQSQVTKKDYRIRFCLIVTHLLLCTCMIVLGVVFNMWHAF